MLTAKISNGNKTIHIVLPKEYWDIVGDLRTIDYFSGPSSIMIRNDESAKVKVELSSESDMGNKLIKIFNRNTPLEEVNHVIFKIQNCADEIKEELEQNILYEQYRNTSELLNDIKDMTYNVGQCTETFYFPLSGEIVEHGDYEQSSVGNEFLMRHKWAISERIELEQEDMNEDMKDFFYDDDTAQAKMLSATWGVVEKNDVLYGKVDFRLREPFTDEERKRVKEWVSGQNSDGFGEGFEQHEIETDEGDLYVSMWNSSDNYFIYDEDEMNEHLGNAPTHENTQSRRKPDCELIGQDGNIFNLIGIASRTLKRNNMHDEAKEMSDRVLQSESYEEALGIIGDYVNITGPADEFSSYDDDEDYDSDMEMSL